MCGGTDAPACPSMSLDASRARARRNYHRRKGHAQEGTPAAVRKGGRKPKIEQPGKSGADSFGEIAAKIAELKVVEESARTLRAEIRTLAQSL